jgi:toxin ParE1/3/4
MPPVVFTLAAREEMFQAMDWYDARRPGLGERFAAEIDVLVGGIRENPDRFASVGKGVRRAMLRDFPYGLYFLADSDLIQVIACLHSSRNPMRWRGRAQ